MNELLTSTVIFIASGALSFLSAPLFSLALKPVAARIGAIDVPRDERRMHTRPVARIGGVALFLAFLLGGEAFLLFCRPFFTESTAHLARRVIFGGGVIVLGGLADDAYKLSPWQKLLFQTLAALVAAAFGATLFDGWLGATGFIFWCVLLSNAFNLIDGLDGLCTRVAAFCLVALLSLSGYEPLFVILLAALLGFLPLNLRPARLFLGDAGAMLLGFSLAVLSASVLRGSPSFISALSLSLVFALPLFDTSFAALRRMLRGKSPFSPDREHLHHRLVDGGLSHGRASLLLSLLGGGFSSLGALVFSVGVAPVCFILLILLIFASASVIIIATAKPKSDKKDEKYEKG